MRYLLVLALVAVTSCTTNAPVRFDGYKVYRVTPRTIEQLEALKRFEDNPRGFNFWSDVKAVGVAVDIMVPPYLKYDFLDLTVLKKLDVELWIENVQELIDNESSPTFKVPGSPREHDWTRYQTLDELYKWLDGLVEKYPRIVTPVVGGKTYEGREIRGVKISFGPGRKGAFIEGGIHACEWIAPATVTYIANQFLTSTDPSVRDVAESRDWHIFPSTNPDGYVYTHTTDRLWRKTRKPYDVCVGADPNRNWDYHWMDGGASTDSCSANHAGPEPFSEIETKTLSEYINSIASTLDTYLAFHSYDQLFLIPFGHNGHEVPANNDELQEIGEAAADVLATRYGTKYVVGNVPETIYLASGASMDWAVGIHRNIRIVYTYELRDTGRYGFILPPEQIIPTSEETLDSLVEIMRRANASP